MQISFIGKYYEYIEISVLCDLTLWNKTNISNSACVLLNPNAIDHKGTPCIFMC